MDFLLRRSTGDKNSSDEAEEENGEKRGENRWHSSCRRAKNEWISTDQLRIVADVSTDDHPMHETEKKTPRKIVLRQTER